MVEAGAGEVGVTGVMKGGRARAGRCGRSRIFGLVSKDWTGRCGVRSKGQAREGAPQRRPRRLRRAQLALGSGWFKKLFGESPVQRS